MPEILIIIILLLVAAGALITVPMLIRTNRRPVGAAPRRPVLGSPAQVWVSRAERVLRELTTALAEHGAWHEVSTDAAQVVVELRLTAGQVAELDHAVAQIRDQDSPAAVRLRGTRQALLARMAAAVEGMEDARAQLAELIATAATTELIADPDPAGALTSRLAGLRAGLVEVRRLSDPEAGSGIDLPGQGHP